MRIFVTLITFFSISGFLFSYACHSDGCLGIYFLFGVELIIFIAQLIVLFRYAYKQQKAEQPLILNVLGWVSLSMSIIFIPFIFNNDLADADFMYILQGLGVSIFMVYSVIVDLVASWF